MKAIILPKTNLAEGCLIIADSAIGRDTMPLFLPAGNWTLTPLWAFRIGRLGKSVASKFALRYVDGVTAAMLLATANEATPSWLGLMDSALTPGRWMPLDNAVQYGVATNGVETLTLSPVEINNLELAIEHVTDRGTIKTGDIIVLPAPESKPMLLKANTIVEASIGEESVLHLKIK